MSDDVLAKYCSPTLIGMKTGNLFSYSFKDEKERNNILKQLNRTFRKKGLSVIPLGKTENKTLIYVFRPSKLKKDLKCSSARKILENLGYNCEAYGSCIARLSNRISTKNGFPHEIGLFLGYPPEDVCGFIENKAGNYKCCGCWKVYGDEDKALKTFEKYKKCTKLCCSLIAKGHSAEQIAACC